MLTFIPIPFDAVGIINAVIMTNLLNNSTHKLLSVDDDGNYYFVFAVGNENTEAKTKENTTFPKADGTGNHTYLTLAEKVRENLSMQNKQAKESGNDELIAQIPYLGLKKVAVTLPTGKEALLTGARLISTNNGWTMVGSLSHETNKRNADVGLVTLNRKKKTAQTEEEAKTAQTTPSVQAMSAI